MIFFAITLFIIFILILPIPIKVTVHYSESNYYIKLYRFIIFSKDGGVINKFLKNRSKQENTSSKASNKAAKKAVKASKRNIKNKDNEHNKKKISFKALYKKIKCNKFKPTISLIGAINYSLNDAFLDSLSYGLFCNLNTTLYFIFSIVFKVKDYNINFHPKFKDNIIVNITITSIITFSLVKIIYMLFLIIKSRIYIQEVNP